MHGLDVLERNLGPDFSMQDQPAVEVAEEPDDLLDVRLLATSRASWLFWKCVFGFFGWMENVRNRIVRYLWG